ncbi:MAG: hypothetical protein ABJC51_06860, partial [Acidobacteriota bacterium]
MPGSNALADEETAPPLLQFQQWAADTTGVVRHWVIVDRQHAARFEALAGRSSPLRRSSMARYAFDGAGNE